MNREIKQISDYVKRGKIKEAKEALLSLIRRLIDTEGKNPKITPRRFWQLMEIDIKKVDNFYHDILIEIYLSLISKDSASYDKETVKEALREYEETGETKKIYTPYKQKN
ncbi:hypothetical protein ES703_36415 [subsurface metagenome]